MSIRVGLFVLLLSIPVQSQIVDSPPDTVAGIPANYTEANVGSYMLPDPLKLADGQTVRDAETWQKKRRPEIVSLFEQYQFGRSPSRPESLRFDLFDRGTAAFDGKAKRKQVTIHFAKDTDEPKMDLLIYVPADASEPVPLLLNIAFSANSMVVEDPGVREGMIWNREGQHVPASSGRRFGQLDVPAIIDRGLGVATVYYGDIEPDFQTGAEHGVRRLYPVPQPAQDDWGAIAVWAWGLSRALDYLEGDAAVDARRVALMGVSRLGKTVLWAGASDPRFALVIAICSGESGAALSRRNYGETIAHIASPLRYHYWFAPRYQEYAQNVSALPIDSHMLLALIAPRPVLLITGNTDKWSDPYGEFLAAVAAEPVFELLGKKGLGTDEMPAAGTPILNDIGFYMHDGGHGTMAADWDVFLDFMQKHLQR